MELFPGILLKRREKRENRFSFDSNGIVFCRRDAKRVLFLVALLRALIVIVSLLIRHWGLEVPFSGLRLMWRINVCKHSTSYPDAKYNDSSQ